MLCRTVSNGDSVQLTTLLDSVNKYRDLSQEEEYKLARRLRDLGDTKAAELLVLHHVRYVVYFASQHSFWRSHRLELVQEGLIGLMKAVKKFNPDENVRLITYAVHYIKSEINEFVLRNMSDTRIITTKGHRKVLHNLSTVRKMSNGKSMPNEQELGEIAKVLNVNENDIKEVIVRYGNRTATTVAHDDDAYDDHGNFKGHVLVDPNNELENLPDEEIHDERLAVIAKAVSTLNDRERDIYYSRIVADADEKIGLAELGNKYSISPERVRQIEVAVMQKLAKFARQERADLFVH